MYQIKVLLMVSACLGKTKMSSIYTHTKVPKWSRRTSFTTRWNVNGALQRPTGITTHFTAANYVLKAVCFNIFVMDSNLVEPTDKVNLRKHCGTPQCTLYALDRRQWVSISNSSGIQGLVVDAHTPFTICLCHQQATRSIWT